MKTALVCRNPELLETLRRAVTAGGHDVVHTAVRRPGAALGTLLDHAPAELLVVEGSCAAPEDLASIERATNERPGLLVLLVCPGRDPEGLIAAMRAGVHEVLHSPVEPDELAAALRRAQRRRPSSGAQGLVIAFIACKGGSGATVLAANFAYTVASEYGKKVALIDLDLESGDASAFLTDLRPKATVADVARQVDRLDAKLLASSMLTVAPGLAVLPAPEDTEAEIAVTGQQIERLIDVAREAFDVVVVDVGRVFDAVAVKALDQADAICPVVEDLVPYIRNAKRLLKSFRGLGYPDGKVHLIVNRYDKRSAIPLAELERAIGAKVRQTVPNSFEDIAQSANLGLPIARVSARNPVLGALRELATRLLDLPHEERGWLGRLVAQE